VRSASWIVSPLLSSIAKTSMMESTEQRVSQLLKVVDDSILKPVEKKDGSVTALGVTYHVVNIAQEQLDAQFNSLLNAADKAVDELAPNWDKKEVGEPGVKNVNELVNKCKDRSMQRINRLMDCEGGMCSMDGVHSAVRRIHDDGSKLVNTGITKAKETSEQIVHTLHLENKRMEVNSKIQHVRGRVSDNISWVSSLWTYYWLTLCSTAKDLKIPANFEEAVKIINLSEVSKHMIWSGFIENIYGRFGRDVDDVNDVVAASSA